MRNRLLFKLNEMIVDAIEIEEESKKTLDKSYTKNSYGAGYHDGIIESCNEIKEFINLKCKPEFFKKEVND